MKRVGEVRAFSFGELAGVFPGEGERVRMLFAAGRRVNVCLRCGDHARDLDGGLCLSCRLQMEREEGR